MEPYRAWVVQSLGFDVDTVDMRLGRARGDRTLNTSCYVLHIGRVMRLSRVVVGRARMSASSSSGRRGGVQCWRLRTRR